MLKKLKENILASSYEDRAGRSVISVKTLMEIIDRLAAEQPENEAYKPEVMTDKNIAAEALIQASMNHMKLAGGYYPREV